MVGLGGLDARGEDPAAHRAVKAFPAETTEAFCDGHNAAFRCFGGVPRRIVYDNTKLAVARILGDGTRQRTQVFSELQSHYLFDDRFGRPGKGNDKGYASHCTSLDGCDVDRCSRSQRLSPFHA